MVSKIKRVLKGTIHNKCCLFYHDWLSLMTGMENCNRMKEKGNEEMWILPEIDLFVRKPFLKQCKGCPPRNIPEICNIYSCLNKDLHKAVDFHFWYTYSLHKLYPKGLSIWNPKKVTSAYFWIFGIIYNVTPSNEWIISDTYGVLTSIKYIMEAKGCIILNVNNMKLTVRGF